MLVGRWRERVGSGASCRTICRLGRCVSADAALAPGGLFRVAGRGCAVAVARVGRAKSQPTAVVIDSRTLQSTPESGARAGYDGAKRRKGSKVHIAVDTLGH